MSIGTHTFDQVTHVVIVVLPYYPLHSVVALHHAFAS